VKLGAGVYPAPINLELNYICRLESFGAFDHLELHRSTFLQAAVTVSLDCRKVNEHILATLPLDKTIALTGIKPLHGSLLAIITHVYFYSLMVNGAVISLLLLQADIHKRPRFDPQSH
jgi:hypothetical protein